ncbi:hypothetical protein [Neobacillus thermocopriae]|uniref:Pilus assembly protein PilO n=1 Tax=Neobacillus thermocopriae TaxID=1215031 RepID=A0A6B3TPN2_9BACI|nr:hypothetical protein [Neobacillus thermocopriae]MED3623671.1 hypothetical protein [Neobacillus thermocopriae]MED3712890.1 hypothetical protein [Neobacillus thermocopriae]NEX78356.1 hypothetical protein [Neobacillus thermocopriae]
MTKWLEQNKNIVLIIILFILLLLVAFYLFMIRPLALEEKNQQQQLNRIKSDFSYYQQSIKSLQPNSFSDEEKELLIGSIPSKPYIEEIIKDLERTELENEVVIENISYNLNENRLSDDEAVGKTEEETRKSGKENWENILSQDVMKKFKEQIEKVEDLPISFVELTIDVNGEAEKVNQFVSQLENLKRIIHVQSYEYKINKEKDNRLEGIVTIRAFYSEKLAEFIDEKMDFELDYEFDPQKVKRYVDPNEQS